MQRERELRDGAEVAAAAAQTPQQLRILVRAGRDDAAVSRHDLGAHQVVAREPVLGREPPLPAAQREPADTGVRDAPTRRGEVMLLRCRVDVDPGAPAAGGRGAGCRIDVDLSHRRQIDDDALAQRGAGDPVAAAAHRDRQAGVTREAQRLGDLGRVLRPGYRRRTNIDHGIEDRPGGVITGIFRGNNLTGEGFAQLVNNRGSHGILLERRQELGGRQRSLGNLASGVGARV